MSADAFESTREVADLIPIPTAEEIRERSKKKKKKKIITTVVIIFALLALCSAGGIFVYQKYGPKSDKGGPDLMKVEPVPVLKGTFENIITGKGKLEAVTSVLVNSELGGTVKTVSVVEGQQVEKGDTLFVTSNPETIELRSSALAAASAAKEANNDANSAYSSAKKELSGAEKDVSSAKSALSQAKASGSQEAISAAQSRLDAAKATEAGAREMVTSAKAGLRTSQLELESARKELTKIDRQINSATVKAPISGTVIGVNIKPGSILAPTMGSETGLPAGAETPTSAIEIADLSSMTMRTSVTERDVVSIQVGQAAQVTFDALPGVTAQAKVVRVAPKATASDPNNFENGLPAGSSGPAKYDVDIQLDNPDPRLRYGMTAQVSITVASEKNVLMISSSSVIRDGEKTFVEVLKTPDALGEPREISISLSSKDMVVVTSGLKEGELINPFPESGVVPQQSSPEDPASSGGASVDIQTQEQEKIEVEASVAK